MTDPTTPAKPPPRGLAANGKALWRNIIGTYVLDPGEVVLLHQLCRSVDVLDRLHADLAEMGAVVAGSTGQPVVNPVIAAIREEAKLVDRLQQALALPLTGETAGVRRSGSRKAAARASSGGRKTGAARTNVKNLTEGGPRRGTKAN